MKLKDLEKLAQDATPGPWEGSPKHRDAVIAPSAPEPDADCREYYGGFLVSESSHERNAAYIAAHNPERMKRIYELLREAREALTYYARWQSPDAGERADDVLAKLEDL